MKYMYVYIDIATCSHYEHAGQRLAVVTFLNIFWVTSCLLNELFTAGAKSFWPFCRGLEGQT